MYDTKTKIRPRASALLRSRVIAQRNLLAPLAPLRRSLAARSRRVALARSAVPAQRSAERRRDHDRGDHGHRPLPGPAAVEGVVRRARAVDLRRPDAGAEGLTWDPRNAERVLERADAVIGPMRIRAPTYNPIKIFRALRAARRLARNPKARRWPTCCRPISTPVTTRCAQRHMPDDDADEKTAPGARRAAPATAPRSTTSASRRTPASARRSSA